MVYPGERQYVDLAADCDVVPVCRDLLADTETPVSVLQRFCDDDNVFLLESMEGGETWGRYSIVGIDAELCLEVDHSVAGSGSLQALRDVYKDKRVHSIPGMPRFMGGVVGYLAYEAIGEFETMPPPKTATSAVRPVSRFVKVDRLIVFDNLRNTMTIVVATHPGDAASPADAHRAAVAEIGRIETLLNEPSGARVTDADRGAPPVEFASNMSRDEFLAMVEKTKQYIYDGDVIQAVVSQRFTTANSVPPIQLYRALRLLNPAPYLGFLKIGHETLVSSSPEVMVRLTGRRVELRPIAGTRPRGATEEEDLALADELLADEKEKAEHVMLVDLGRNDIGRIAETDSVEVTDYMVIERYSHVMHMVSHVEGVLRPEFDAYDVIAASFPAGTLSGAPKIRAMQIIHELEPEPRGPYGGAFGYIGYDGNMDLAITIRTLHALNGEVSVQAGAGVVYDSVPEREYDETCHKARGMRKAVALAANGLELSEDAP